MRRREHVQHREHELEKVNKNCVWCRRRRMMWRRSIYCSRLCKQTSYKLRKRNPEGWERKCGVRHRIALEKKKVLLEEGKELAKINQRIREKARL